jgi:hypothetical protein
VCEEVYERSSKKFEVLGRNEVAMRLPLPLVEVWEELQPEVEHLTGLAGLKIIRAVIEDEVTRRVGPRYQPAGEEGCLRWGQQAGYVVFAGQKAFGGSHHGDFAHGNFGHGGFDHGGGFHGSSGFHGGSNFHPQSGMHSGAFGSFNHGGDVRGFSSRGRSSV